MLQCLLLPWVQQSLRLMDFLLLCQVFLMTYIGAILFVVPQTKMIKLPSEDPSSKLTSVASALQTIFESEGLPSKGKIMEPVLGFNFCSALLASKSNFTFGNFPILLIQHITNAISGCVWVDTYIIWTVSLFNSVFSSWLSSSFFLKNHPFFISNRV